MKELHIKEYQIIKTTLGKNMELAFDMLEIGDADAFIIWAKHNGKDFIVFIDGGKEGDGDNVVALYRRHIAPHVETQYSNPEIILINTHPHNDHVRGIPFIVNYFKNRIARVYMNNPFYFMSPTSRKLLVENYAKVRSSDTVLTRLYESLQKGIDLENLIRGYNIPIYNAFSDYSLHQTDTQLFQFLGPSSYYYQELVNRFSALDAINSFTYRPIPQGQLIIESQEEKIPCTVVDEKDDTSAENLSSVITQFTTGSGKKYLFTGDAGVESFYRAKQVGFDLKNINYVQLPHHGSRRNIDSANICEFNPEVFFVSAAGNDKHPRKAVISCIKKNTRAIVYSSHRNSGFYHRSNTSLFPDRPGFGPATPYQ